MSQNQQEMWIPMSYLNAYAYCPRRFYYEFTLGEMVANEHVFAGQQLHERVDQWGRSSRQEKVQFHHIYLCAPLIGILGYCDILEAEGPCSDPAVAARQQKLYPVEYKKGKQGKWISDHTQLCAQALALEEVLDVPAGSVSHGYIYYIESARRDEVILDTTLRNQTMTMLSEARRIAQLPCPPDPITNWRKCRDCSLEPICLPREVRKIQCNEKNGEEDGTRIFD